MESAGTRQLRVRWGALRAPWGAMMTAAVAGAVLIAGAGCGATCDRTPNREPERFTDGMTDTEDGVYESSPWVGPFLWFPKGKSYELVHGLGSVPREVVHYLSFERCPMAEPCEPGDTEESNVAIGAGNQGVIESVTAESIIVRNDTCSDIYLRVVASHPEGRTTPSTEQPDASTPSTGQQPEAGTPEAGAPAP